jgi:hypothetical protein
MDTSQANCLNAPNPDIFFPDDEEKHDKNLILLAKRFCGECLIREQCLAVAMDNLELEGVWGGTTKYERRNVNRMAKRRDIEKTYKRLREEPNIKMLKSANEKRAAMAGLEAQGRLKLALEILGNSADPLGVEIALIRISNPEIRLGEIGQMLDKPVSKDVVAGRIRRLLDNAERVKNARISK